ncbi:MAG: hypothetical protein MUO39_04410 [Steroidobacteraceae bacterium]|nr:hypothetical protein [Steroidobacteraceae bacterium]
MNPNTRAPWHLWVVGIAALLWNAVGALDYVMTQTRNAQYMAAFTAEQLEFFYGLPAWTVAAWAIGVWGGVLGSLLLLLRKSLATWVFLASLIGVVLTTFQNYVLSNGLEVMGGPGAVVFTAVIFLVAVALYVYARAMTTRRVLA